MISLDDVLDNSGVDVNLNPIYNSLNALNSEMSSINSSIASIKTDTSSIWNFVSTLTGGGGSNFDYLEEFTNSAHSTLKYRYNVSGNYSNVMISQDYNSVGPCFNIFSNTVSTDRYLNIEGFNALGNSFINNNLKMKFKDYNFNLNSFENCKNVEFGGCDNFAYNSFKNDYLVNGTIGVGQNNTFEYCKNIKLYVESLNDGQIFSNDLFKINGGEISGNTFKDNNFIDFDCIKVSSNRFTQQYPVNIKCATFDGAYAEAYQFDVNAYVINNLTGSEYSNDYTMGEWKLKGFFMENIYLHHIQDLYIDRSGYLLNCNFSMIGCLHMKNPFYFISEEHVSSQTDLSANVYVWDISSFDIDHISKANPYGAYTLTWIPSKSLYVNGVPYSKCV